MKLGIFCDCHNTLMNSNKAWIEAYVEFLGHEYLDEIKICLYGKIKRRELAARYNLDFNLIEKAAEKYLLENKKLIEILNYLRSKGVPLFVVSNAPKRRVIGDLECVGFKELFTEIYTGDEGGKKNNKIFDHILEKYGLDFGIFIGNEEFDDHIDHPKIISVVLTTFLRERFNILNTFNFDEEGVIKI
jgi:HAD superfamily hydrolase (TIGR01549 family)